MATVMTASREWSRRPQDERFVNLLDLDKYCREIRETSHAKVVSSKRIEFAPTPGDENESITVVGPNGHGYLPTHHSFGQLASLAGAPPGYLRGLPAPIAADCLNYGMKFDRDIADVGVLLRKANELNTLRAATGPNYGRVWNHEITSLLVKRFGDGITGDWRAPGEFGKDVVIDKRNTTFYASDHDMFVFLADEKRRIEIPNRRQGKAGSMARGFFVWNGENGGTSLGGAFFLFDYVCCNRIVWGAEQFQEVRIRHTSSAPDRWLDEVTPVLQEYAEASAKPVVQAIADAREQKLNTDLNEFLKNRFTKSQISAIEIAHKAEEGRPIETVWDAVTGITAYARTMPHQDERIKAEREAGKLLQAA